MDLEGRLGNGQPGLSVTSSSRPDKARIIRGEQLCDAQSCEPLGTSVLPHCKKRSEEYLEYGLQFFLVNLPVSILIEELEVPL